MESEQFLVNSKGEAINLDELYSLEPILADIFSSDLSQYNTVDAINSQQTSIKSEAKQLSYNTSWSSYINGPQHQEISTKPSNSSFSSSCPSQLISFGKSNQTENLHRILSRDSSVSPQIIKFSSLTMKEPLGKKQYEMGAKKVPCSVIRSPLQAQDHVMSERKRREKLSQLFINLSKVVPGLKKLDKASLLGDAIKHVQELQERVRILEEEAEEANRNLIITSNANYSATRNSIPTLNSFSSKESSINSGTRESVPAEIKARISNNNVMIKIFHKKHKGLVSRIQYEMENLHLNVLDVRAMPFGSSTVDITILAEMKREFCVTVEDIVEHLEMAFLNRQA
ncbi:transcription factor bHLH18-like [Olea europaea var. sylvestris]|uniref:transcription factor bHLH18-like n=1 Tax=Olea europaea var. sylvestris TaxID=158386 RepID=UPI000C1D0A0D|nr:transcription factor bHLH18-like [Olea europaea var. sylvestris]